MLGDIRLRDRAVRLTQKKVRCSAASGESDLGQSPQRSRAPTDFSCYKHLFPKKSVLFQLRLHWHSLVAIASNREIFKL